MTSSEISILYEELYNNYFSFKYLKNKNWRNKQSTKRPYSIQINIFIKKKKGGYIKLTQHFQLHTEVKINNKE